MTNAPTVGFALCGSFCTFEEVIRALRAAAEIYNIIPIMSNTSAVTDSRFGKASDFKSEIESICKRKVLVSLPDVEPIGPKKLLDLLVIAPTTGNTLAKLASGISDTGVTLAYKAHLRNSRPVLIAISTNDALSNNAANIGVLLNRRNHFFVPFGQDDPSGKPTSLVADFSLIPDAIDAALHGKQLQPILKAEKAGG
ncbi:MAG: dipicolinate synthase subunit B [Oscillospiraceae bacterium]|jgi:dipicolinate synthase subunit B|nr:dipicolinate synthase subunit B [Oscillospiraceae bacterium]